MEEILIIDVFDNWTRDLIYELEDPASFIPFPSQSLLILQTLWYE